MCLSPHLLSMGDMFFFFLILKSSFRTTQVQTLAEEMKKKVNSKSKITLFSMSMTLWEESLLKYEFLCLLPVFSLLL